jgi:hypothetical protein
MSARSWRAGDSGLCGANHVQIAALDGRKALVVGGGQFGPWSIWMEASKLRCLEIRGRSTPPAIHRIEDSRDAPEPAAGIPPARKAA